MDSFHSNIEDDYPGYTTIQQNIIDLLDPADMDYYLSDKSLAPLRRVPVCIAAAVYRMSAGNCMPYTGNNDKPEDQNLLSFNAYQRNESPWSSYRQRSHKHHRNKNSDKAAADAAEDISSSGSSCSTLEESTCSSRSDSPEPKHHCSSTKKRSYHMLLREIRRLRGENEFLRSSVSVLKNDLRDCTISRQNADVIHQRIYGEFENRHVKLEEELLSGKDEIKELKDQIEHLQLASSSCCNNSQFNTTSTAASSPTSNSSLTLHDAAYFKRKSSNVFGCYEFEEDDENMSCQPVAHESALPEVVVKMDHLKSDEEEAQQVNDYFTRRFGEDYDGSTSPQDESEEEEDEEEEDLEPFEQVATSYIHQAIVAKLSSARVRLEFDDLILKYEPTTDVIIAVLAESFVNWIKSILQKVAANDNDSPLSKIFHTKIQAGIHEFWESILQCYTTEDDNQVQLLNHIENELENKTITQQPDTKSIIDHFDRLALMLYKYSVVDDAAVTAWWQNPLNNDISKKIRTVTSHFYDWVQDEEEDGCDDSDEDDDEKDDEEDDEDDDDDEDDNGGEEDDNQAYSDDEHTGFSFTDSPIPEVNEEDDTFEFEHDVQDTTTLLQQNIEDLLTTKERDPCVCQFDNDTSKKNNTSTSFKHECSCDNSTYTPTPHEPSAAEKKKKSVRICDVNII